MKQALLVILLGITSFITASAQYERLDSLIRVQGDIVAQYEQRIDSLKLQLHTARTTKRRYLLTYELCEAYASFQNDSARSYVRQAIKFADQLGDIKLQNQSRLQNVHILSGAGLLEQAQSEIERIDASTLFPEQCGMYFRLLIEHNIYQAEYNQHTEYEQEYIDRLIALREEGLEKIPPTDEGYMITYAEVMSDQDKHKVAIDRLCQQLAKYHSGERTYSILTSTIAFIYGKMGLREEQKHYLILSAESDLAGAIRENTSLRVLSSMLFDEGDYDRAYRYLSCCISDASFYGARLRNTQVSSLMPKVLSAYEESQQRSQRRGHILLIIISCVAIALAAALVGLYLVFRRLRRTSFTLTRTNEKLHERELVKEEYIGRFLALSSQFIEQTDTRRKFLLRTAREKKASDLIDELKNTSLNESQAKEFYENFDEAFLNIFPDFCQHVNALLEPDGQITPPSSNMLTTELRILALMRLGITSNQLIASILRSGLSTVYTYRSRLKARAIDHDNFEAQVKLILNNE